MLHNIHFLVCTGRFLCSFHDVKIRPVGHLPSRPPVRHYKPVDRHNPISRRDRCCQCNRIDYQKESSVRGEGCNFVRGAFLAFVLRCYRAGQREHYSWRTLEQAVGQREPDMISAPPGQFGKRRQWSQGLLPRRRSLGRARLPRPCPPHTYMIHPNFNLRGLPGLASTPHIALPSIRAAGNGEKEETRC